jgi:hypothetical protein
MGVDTARADDRAAGPLSVHRYRGVCFRLYPGSLVSGEGVDAAPAGSSRGAWGARASIEAVVQILVRHGGGEGGHYFTVQAAQIWRQMPQVILRYPYAGVDFRGDPDMVLPPGEVFDHRGMLSFVYVFDLCYVLIYQFICDIDTDMIFVCCFVHVQIWHLAGARWSCRERRFSESRRDCHVERGVGEDEAAGPPAEPERARGGADMMTLVRGHHMLLRRQPE